MMSSKERREERLANVVSDTLSERAYNLVLGGIVLYGFVVNALIVGFAESYILNMNMWVLIIGYFISCILGAVISSASHNPFISFLGYNMIVVPVGAVLTIGLKGYSEANILAAMIMTGGVVFAMITASAAFPNFFSSLGMTLFCCLGFGVLAEIIAMLFGYRGALFDWFFVIIFSLYIGYDWYRAQEYSKTLDNAVDSAIDIYLDIVNLFIRLLEIMSRSSRRK